MTVIPAESHDFKIECRLGGPSTALVSSEGPSQPANERGVGPAPATTTEEPDMTDTDLLTITEAAALLRTPVATLRWWRHQGTGPASFRIGRRVFYRRRDLEAWIAAQRERDNRGRTGAA
jgi:excisionase family DNA binding protein